MKIVCVALGTRGDVQPVMALARGLRGTGNEVAIAAGHDARVLVESNGIDFIDLGFSIDDEIRSDAGQAWVTDSGANALRELVHMRRFFRLGSERVADSLLKLSGQADMFVSGLLSFDMMSSIATHDGVPHANLLFSPMAATREGRAGVVSGNTKYLMRNLALSKAVERTFATIIVGAGGQIVRERLGMKETGARGFVRALGSERTALAVSPTLTPQPLDWPISTKVTGPLVLLPPSDFTPPEDLARFLGEGKPTIYLGFGSATFPRPEQMSVIARKVAESTGVRVVVAGSADSGQVNEAVYAVGSIPHEWLFPHLDGIIHHGGSGTTHAALRSGTPQFVVPFVSDQPYWGRRTHEEGIAVAPIPLAKFTPARLVRGINELFIDTTLKARAQELGVRAREGDGVEETVSHLLGSV